MDGFELSAQILETLSHLGSDLIFPAGDVQEAVGGGQSVYGRLGGGDGGFGGGGVDLFGFLFYSGQDVGHGLEVAGHGGRPILDDFTPAGINSLDKGFFPGIPKLTDPGLEFLSGLKDGGFEFDSLGLDGGAERDGLGGGRRGDDEQ